MRIKDELVLKQNTSYINRAVSMILSSDSNEQVQELVKSEYPHYDPCDTTLTTIYDSALKERLVDKQPENLPVNCLSRERVIIKDAPFEPVELCCCCPCPPKPEKVFVRPTGECQVVPAMPTCDNRVHTIVHNMPIMETLVKEGNNYYGDKLENKVQDVVFTADVRKEGEGIQQPEPEHNSSDKEQEEQEDSETSQENNEHSNEGIPQHTPEIDDDEI